VFKDELIAETCRLFHVHPRDLVGDYRFDFLMPARFALAKALRLRGWTYPQIGRELGRDHSTIIYRVREAEYRMGKDPSYAEKIHHLATYTIERPEAMEMPQAEAA